MFTIANKNAWTDERTVKLKELADLGYSASGIAYELRGVTRNAVIGKLARMGISLSRASATPSQKGITKQRYLRTKAPRDTKPARSEDIAPDPFVPRSVNVQPKHISILQLNENTCRWPYGDTPETTTYCGHQPFGTMSYCAAHCRLAYQPASKRTPSTFRIIRGRAA